MKENRINRIREEIRKYFDPNGLIEGSEEIFYSPNNAYFFKSTSYQQNDTTRNWTVSKIEVFVTNTNEKIVEFIRNEDSFFHGWLQVDGMDYLFLSEDLEGKSIYDLTNRVFHSFSFDEDTFIWCEYFPSPDNRKMAVIGCYWACPYEIVVYDTSQPTSYPYKELYRQESFQETREWVTNDSIMIIAENGNTKKMQLGK